MTTKEGAGRAVVQYARLEVRPELVDPAEAAGLAGARQEAFGSNGAPLPGAVLPDVTQQHLVLLRRPRPLPHRRLLAAATARLHPRWPRPAATTTRTPVPSGGALALPPSRAQFSPAPCRVRMDTKAQGRCHERPLARRFRE